MPSPELSLRGKLSWYNEKVDKLLHAPHPENIELASKYLKNQKELIGKVKSSPDQIVVKKDKSPFDFMITLAGTIITALGTIMTLYLSWRKEIREAKETIKKLSQKS